MPKKIDKNLIVALDVGTSKIAALVGEVGADNQIEVIGYGTHPSRGLKRGMVVNIEATVESIRKAIEEAEAMAGCDIRSAYTGIAGNHIRSLNSHGIVPIRDREVNMDDVERVMEAAKAVAIPADQQVLHVLPQEFIIDHQVGVREPIGMSGVRLEARVHLITGSVNATENLTKCVRRCGIDVGDMVLEQLASGRAVLTEDEKELGVAVLDLGAGTSDIAVFTEGAIRHTGVLPIAGDSVTNDIAVALRIPTPWAEQLKIEHGTAHVNAVHADEMVDISTIAKRPMKPISKKLLAQVIAARYEELFNLVRQDLRQSGCEDLLAAGLVLTGGASKMPGIVELAESVFELPVRLGVPQSVKGLHEICGSPMHSTGIGLLLMGHHHQTSGARTGSFDSSHQGLWQRMKRWVQGNF